VNGLDTLYRNRLEAGWEADVDRISRHYNFDNDQNELAQAALKKAKSEALPWFQDAEQEEKRRKYLSELHDVQTVERNPAALSFQRERAAARRKDLDVDRKALVAPLREIGATLHDSMIKLATAEQREAAGPFTIPWTSLDWVNASTKWGLVAMGVCLMLGLFTPLAALAGAVFLGQIYMSMPPWPGLPPSPIAEGHYFIVNKNLVEMIACLALATIPTGMWIGFDALLFGWISRRRRRGPDGPSAPPESSPNLSRSARTQSHETGPIPV
jgi:uncharacterized membrane protein YphA (DoxX/SURF4 family)